MVYTDPFYTSNGGYKATLSIYPNGYGSGEGTHVSVFINLMKGFHDDKLPFPINGIFTIKMYNWKKDGYHIDRSIEFDEGIPMKYRERVTTGEIAYHGWGYQQFLSHEDLAKKNVLHEDGRVSFKISYTPTKGELRHLY